MAHRWCSHGYTGTPGGWAAPANPQITPPEAPLTAETVRQFVAAVAAQPEFEWRVHVEPAPEGARATIDELEDFAHRCEDGTVTVEDMDRHDISLHAVL